MSATIQSYRDLIAWQKSMDIVEAVYCETSHLPNEELYGLVSQLRRCAVSIPSNIAEGWGRHSKPDYIRFLRMSQGSLYELSTQAELSDRLGFKGDWKRIMKSADEIRRILYGLIKSLNASG